MITKEQVVAWIESSATVMHENKAFLTELDAAIGDADHGINMDRGFSKVAEKLATETGDDIGALLKTVGMTLMSSVGGASGPLYGTFFMKAGMALMGKTTVGSEELCTLVEEGLGGLLLRGRANVGDKTMVDVWTPVLEAMKASAAAGKDPVELLAEAVTVSEEAVEATKPLQAKKGRASYLGERSIGHQDPGATSSAMLINAFYNAVA